MKSAGSGSTKSRMSLPDGPSKMERRSYNITKSPRIHGQITLILCCFGNLETLALYRQYWYYMTYGFSCSTGTVFSSILWICKSGTTQNADFHVVPALVWSDTYLSISIFHYICITLNSSGSPSTIKWHNGIITKTI